MNLSRVTKFIQRNWFGIGWIALLAFILIAPRPGSIYFEFMVSLLSSFAFMVGLLLATNYHGLAERFRDRAIADSKRLHLAVSWADRSIAFARFMGVFFTLWGASDLPVVRSATHRVC